MSAFSREVITTIVQASGAYDNKFFRWCHRSQDPVPVWQLVPLVRAWYPFIKTFGLSAPKLVAHLSALLLQERNPFHDHLIGKAVQIAARSSAQDLGVAETTGMLHYQLFGRICTALGWAPTPVHDFKEVGMPVSDVLRRMQDSFLDLEAGLAWQRVIEGTSLQIVRAMEAIFLRAVDEQGTKVFSDLADPRLLYVAHHLTLEGKRDEHSAELVELLFDTATDVKQVRFGRLVHEFATTMGQFWDEIHQQTMAVAKLRVST